MGFPPLIFLTVSVGGKQHYSLKSVSHAEELCDSRGGRPGFSLSLIDRTVSVDVQQQFYEEECSFPLPVVMGSGCDCVSRAQGRPFDPRTYHLPPRAAVNRGVSPAEVSPCRVRVCVRVLAGKRIVSRFGASSGKTL